LLRSVITNILGIIKRHIYPEKIAEQRNLTSRQEQLILTQAQTLVDLIAPYKAPGVGWDIEQSLEFSGE
jgi:outer membrane protein TolC